MTSEQAIAVGNEIVRMFALKPIAGCPANDVRYATDWGTKTVEGIGKCVERIVTNTSSIPIV